MTILMPQSPGHWTEAVLLRLEGSTLEQEPNQPLRVTFDVADGMVIDFEEEPNPLKTQGEPEYFYATLRQYTADQRLEVETLLYEAPAIDLLLDEVEAWSETYYEAAFELDQLIKAAEAGEIL